MERFKLDIQFKEPDRPRLEIGCQHYRITEGMLFYDVSKTQRCFINLDLIAEIVTEQQHGL